MTGVHHCTSLSTGVYHETDSWSRSQNSVRPEHVLYCKEWIPYEDKSTHRSPFKARAPDHNSKESSRRLKIHEYDYQAPVPRRSKKGSAKFSSSSRNSFLFQRHETVKVILFYCSPLLDMFHLLFILLYPYPFLLKAPNSSFIYISKTFYLQRLNYYSPDVAIHDFSFLNSFIRLYLIYFFS